DLAQRDRDRAVAAERRSEENFQMARQAVDRYFSRVSENPALKARGLESLRQQLLATAGEVYEKFVRQRADDPSLRSDLGDANVNRGNINRIIAKTDQAEAAYKQAVALFEALSKGKPAEPQYQRQLAAVFSDLGLLYADTRRFKDAETVYLRSLETEREL